MLTVETILSRLSQHVPVAVQEIALPIVLDGEPTSLAEFVERMQQAGLPLVFDGKSLLVHPDASLPLTRWLQLPTETTDVRMVHGKSVAVKILKCMWISSTQTELVQQPAPAIGEFSVITSEYQSGGRGRLGRQWLQSIASGIALSVSYTFADKVELPPLGLAIAVELASMLRTRFSLDIRLKWPNDLLLDERKCAGILLESRQVEGRENVVIGIGVNTHLTAKDAREISSLGGQRPAGALMNLPVTRTELLMMVIDTLLSVLVDYRSFEPFINKFDQLDVLKHTQVCWQQRERTVKGEALGVNSDGSLNVRTERTVERVYAGDIDRYVAVA